MKDSINIIYIYIMEVIIMKNIGTAIVCGAGVLLKTFVLAAGVTTGLTAGICTTFMAMGIGWGLCEEAKKMEPEGWKDETVEK